MARVFLRRGLLGESGTEQFDVPAGLTPRAIVDAARPKLPASVSLQLARNGRLLEEWDELDVPLEADDEVILSPVTTGIELLTLVVYAVIAAAVSFAVNYAMQALAPRPKAPGVPAERGDQSSATYSWDGVTTSYGQGFPVPIVYGRHGVGGQVIYSNANVAWNGTTDRLDIVLALSEGPVHRVGDVIATELNALGGLGGTPGTGPLPDGIYVNNTLLEAEANAPVRNHLTFTTWSTTPNLAVGSVLQFSVSGSGGPWVGSLQVIEVPSPGTVDIVAVLNAAGVPQQPYTAGTWIRELSSGAVTQVATTSLVTRPNPTPGALVYIRPGTLDQTPLPSDPFRGTATTFAPATAIDQESQEQVFAYTSEEAIEAVSFVFAAPAGCYVQDPQGNLFPYPVEIDVGWRAQGAAAWNSLWGGFTGNTEIRVATLFPLPKYGPQLQVVAGKLNLNGAPVPGPLEVRVRRRSPAAGIGGVSNIVWRNVSFNTGHTLGYPRVALLGLSLAATARFNGGLPNFLVRVEGVKVRVWHPEYGWYPSRVWDKITTGDHAFMRWAPGRNPAWILLDFLTSSWGLGKYITDADIDLLSIFRWSIQCDQTWGLGTDYEGPEFTFDGVFDAPRPAWEIVLAICGAGRAAPVFRNGKIGVAYQYRDSHAAFNGLTPYDVVPEREPLQLITEGACEKVQVTWLPKATRATALNFQFLNEEALWRQDVFPVQDAQSTLDDPTQVTREQYRAEVVQAFGVTRPAQVFREGVFRHRVSRLVRRELSFVTGPWALAAEVGDLFEFEHEVLRPFGTDVPTAMLVVVGGASVTSIVVDHSFSLPADPNTYEVVVRSPDGEPQRATIDMTTHAANGTTLVLVSAVTCDPGAQCVVGLIGKTVETYQVVAITVQQDLKREVRALQWVPEVFDEVTVEEFEAGGETVGLIDQPDALPVSTATGLDDFQVLPQRDGAHVVAFSRSPSAVGRTARLYARSRTTEPWSLLGATETDEIVVRHFLPGTTYTLSLSIDTADGDPPTPDGGTKHTFVAEEFPRFLPPSLSVASAAVTPAGELVVQWAPIESRDLDHYEVRIGDRWNGAAPVYRGTLPRAVIAAPGVSTGGTALVAVRGTGGLYGNPIAATLPTWAPPGRVLQASEDDVVPSPAGGHSGTAWNASDAAIELSGSNLTGTYTALELDVGWQATMHWSVDLYARELDEITVEEAEDSVDSGEAAWRTVEGRAASPFRPGIDDWSTLVDDDERLVDDCGDDEVHGAPAAVGTFTRALVESRFETDGVYGAWAKHVDGPVRARKMQVRVVLDRESIRYQVQVPRLRFAAYL